MSELFKKDITIKIGSILIAVLFWLYVYNTTNPFVPRTFANVPLKIENENYLDDNGYIVKNKYKTSIDITIRGRQDAIDKVRPTDFEAAIDFSQIKSVGDKTLKVSYPTCTQKDVKIESYTPGSIDIQLARNKSNSFPVELVKNITLKPGYTILKMSLDPDNITIVDEEALIDTVASIKAALDIKDLDRDYSKKVNCKVYNKDGKEIASLSKNLNVEVKVEVAKEVPVTVVTKGKPDADYVQASIAVTPDKALITGQPDILNKITELKIQPVDIEGIKQDMETASSIVLPSGVNLANTAKEVTVDITLEKLEIKEITLAKTDISIVNTVNDGMLNYEIKDESIPIQLKGRLSELSNISAADLKPTIDAAGLSEGTHKLPVNITLPYQVKLMQGVFADVKVSKAETAAN